MTPDSLTLPAIAAAIIVFVILYVLAKKRIQLARAEAELRKLCFGDVATMERLIAFEQERTPGQERAAAARAASYAIKRDRK